MNRRTALQALGGVLLALSLLAGAQTDERPARPVEYRAGYRVLQGDFHAHTRFSDGVVSPCDLVLNARRRGLDAVAITEHNSVFPAMIGRACAPFIEDAPLVLIGEEITTREVHMLAIGIERDVDARMSPKRVIDAVHEQGGVVIAAHPTRRFWPALLPVCDRLDGVEVVHPIAFRGDSGIGPYSDMVEFAESPCGQGKAMIGDSDYHAGSVLGILRTYLFVDSASGEGVVDAIRKRRTVTVAPDGRMFGPPRLVESLQREPLAARDTSYGYAATGLFDRAGRIAGFAGVLLLCLLGLSRHKP